MEAFSLCKKIIVPKDSTHYSILGEFGVPFFVIK